MSETKPNNLYPWPTFADYGLKLLLVPDAARGNKPILVMAGNTETHAAALSRCGFKKTSRGIWYSDETSGPGKNLSRLNADAFREFFPSVSTSHISQVEIRTGKPPAVDGGAALQSPDLWTRVIDRIKRDLPGLAVPATVRVMTEYSRHAGGVLPLEIHLNAQGEPEQIECFEYSPPAKDWVVTGRVRFQGKRPQGAWEKHGGQLAWDQQEPLLNKLMDSVVDGEFAHGIGFSRFYKERAASKSAQQASDIVSNAKLLGTNSSGERVYSGADGRYVVSGAGTRDEKLIAETVGENPGRFLRAGTINKVSVEALMECAGTIGWGEISGAEAARTAALSAACTFFDLKPDDKRAPYAGELVSLAAHGSNVRTLLEKHVTDLHVADVGPTGLVESIAALSRSDIEAGSAHLTPAMAMLIGRTVRAGSSGWHLRGEASMLLAGMLSPKLGIGSIHKPDLPEGSVEIYRSSLSPVAGRVEITEDPYARGVGFSLHVAARDDAVKVVEAALLYEELLLKRKDQIDAIRAIAGIADNGTAAVMLHLDSNAGPGAATESKYMLQWLADHYEIGFIADVGPRLFGGGDDESTLWRRLIVVNGRRDKALHADVPPITVVREISDLAVLCEQNRGKLAELDSAEIEVSKAAALNLAEKLSNEKLFENRFQTQYVGPSKITATETKTPIFLKDAQDDAFKKLEVFVKQNGAADVDDFVARRLKIPQGELGAMLAADQLDAAALAMYAAARGRGFLIGDQTGVGKGRPMAALILDAINRGKPVVFITARPGLIRTFYKQAQHVVPAEMMKPYVINDKCILKRPDNTIADIGDNERVVRDLASFTSVSALKNAAGETPNIIFATNKQFVSENSAKSDFLQKVLPGSLLIIDEAHELAGDSKSGKNFRNFCALASEVVYSTGTWGQLPQNIHLYERLFPTNRAFDMDLVEEAIRAGGEPIQEMLAQMLTRDGVMIRREHDLSKLDYSIVIDDKRLAQSRLYADAFARFANAMGVLTHQMSALRDDLQQSIESLPQGGRMVVNGIHIGCRMAVGSTSTITGFYRITRQFLLGINTEIGADYAIKVAEEGKKPILMVDATLESLLDEYLEDRFHRMALDYAAKSKKAIDHPAVAQYVAEQREQPQYLDRMPSFGDLLKVAVRRSLAFDFTDPDDPQKGRQRVSLNDIRGHLTPSAQSVFASIETQFDDLMKMAEAFPQMPMSPLDVLREKLEAAGMSVEEVTGRSRQLSKQPDGRYLVVPRKSVDRVTQIERFNNNSGVATIINRAAFSGFDMHADPSFGDTSQRVLIGIHEPDNVKERMQAFGRVFRRGQVSLPAIRTITSGLPAQLRVLAMANLALRKLSASTTGNREHAALADTIDILNPVGDRAAMDFIAQNQAMAARMMIGVRYIPGKVTETGATLPGRYEAHDTGTRGIVTNLSNSLTTRLIMLDVPTQEAAYRQLKAAYDALVQQLDDANENPLKVRQIEGVASIRARIELAQGQGSIEAAQDQGAAIAASNLQTGTVAAATPAQAPDQSVFDAPTYLTTITYDRKPRAAMSARDLFAEMKRSAVSLDSQAIAHRAPPGTPLTSFISEKISASRDKSAREWFKFAKERGTTKADSLEACLADTNDVIGIDIRRKLLSYDRLSRMMSQLRIGSVVSFKEWSSRSQGLVIGISTPDPADIHHPGRYTVSLYEAGMGLRSINLASLIEYDCVVEPQYVAIGGVIPPAFLKRGISFPESAHVVDGNVFMATIEAVRANVGRMPVMYTDDTGVKHQGILMKKGADPMDLLNRPIKVDFDGVGFLRERARTFTSTDFRPGSKAEKIEMAATKSADIWKLKIWSDDPSSFTHDTRLGTLLQSPWDVKGRHIFATVSKFALKDVAAYLQHKEGATWTAPGSVRDHFNLFAKSASREHLATYMQQVNAKFNAQAGLLAISP